MGLYELVTGVIDVRICGAFPESVLNAAAKYDIELRNIIYIDDNTVTLCISERNFAAFEKLCRKCMCDLEITKRQGGSENRKMIYRRKGLIGALAVMMALWIVSSLFIWEIDIRGNESLSRGEILRALSACGVECGTYWPGLSADIIRNEMIEKLPEIGWMAVNVSGSRAIVLIKERTEKPDIYIEKAPADIIADKTGIISKVSVLNGMPRAASGDAVTLGETLISGTMDSITNGSRDVCARGNITADTWYELSSVSPEREELKTPEKLSINRYALVFGKRRINLYFHGGKTIDEYDKIIFEYKLGVEGLFSMPLRLVHEKLRRYDTTPGYAVDTADMENRLYENLRGRVAGEICSKSFSEAISNGVYVLTLRAHCTEEIGKSVPLF